MLFTVTLSGNLKAINLGLWGWPPLEGADILLLERFVHILAGYYDNIRPEIMSFAGREL